MLLSPEVQRNGCQFVDNRDRQAILGQVNRLEVAPAGVAGLHTHVRELICGVDRELLDRFFSARGTANSSVIPLRQAQRAEQGSFCTIPFRSQYPDHGFALTERAHSCRLVLSGTITVIGKKFCIGLQESSYQQRLAIIHTRSEIGRSIPTRGEEFPPFASWQCLQFLSRLSQRIWRYRFHRGKEFGKTWKQEFKIQVVIGKTRKSFSGSITVDSFLGEIESLLKVREMFIEAQHLGRKRMCGCELIGALNSLVPLGSSH